MQLAELPIEVLTDNLFPFFSARELNHLACTSKFFALLCSDDAVWKRKLLVDFNFSGEGTARTSGWKVIYRGLYNPKVFAWGETANGRLGVKDYPKSSVYGVPFPFEVEIPDARIVRLAAGGMSFHALDSEGNVYVWGTLNGSGMGTLPSDGFSEPGKRADTPLKLQLPSPVRSISCGRLHSCALDRRNRVWTFVNWGRPFYFTFPAFSDPLSTPVQIECGWMHSALLTSSGEVFVWWPFSGRLEEIIARKNGEFDEAKDKKAEATSDGLIPCVTWSVDIEPKRLPKLPALPSLSDTGIEKTEPLRLIQIAGLDRMIIGLTNEGHVLKFDSLDNEDTISNGRWEYLPKFCDLGSIRRCKAFSEATGSSQKIELPQTLQITHISANFQHFVSYSTGSSSMVLIGNTQTTADSDPQIKEELQNRSVISVVIGDYHNAALTSNGKLFTWGSFSSGALGLGDPAKLKPGQPGGYAASSEGRRLREPPPVKVPTEVRFDHGRENPKDRFCFSVTAAGWHTGALVIDLEVDDEKDHYEMESDPDPIVPMQEEEESHHPYESPPFVNPALGIFRIGHAGRGRGRGRGHFVRGCGTAPPDS